MTDLPEFRPWEKIARLRRSVIVTEKIDGTNAAVIVTTAGDVFAQSRKRVITPEADNQINLRRGDLEAYVADRQARETT